MPVETGCFSFYFERELVYFAKGRKDVVGHVFIARELVLRQLRAIAKGNRWSALKSCVAKDVLNNAQIRPQMFGVIFEFC